MVKQFRVLAGPDKGRFFLLPEQGSCTVGTSHLRSENLREILGHPPEAALSPDWWRANIHPDDRDKIIAETHAELHTHGYANHEYRFRHGDGTYDVGVRRVVDRRDRESSARRGGHFYGHAQRRSDVLSINS